MDSTLDKYIKDGHTVNDYYKLCYEIYMTRSTYLDGCKMIGKHYISNPQLIADSEHYVMFYATKEEKEKYRVNRKKN